MADAPLPTPHRARTALLANLAAVLERCDEQMVPAVYRSLGAAFSATPTQLGYIALSRALVQALTSPIGGIAGHCLHRGRVVGCGCLLWSACTAAFAACNSLAAGVAVWGVNGLGLALSLTADLFSSAQRGRAFGVLYLTAALGGMLGALYATNMSSHRPLGLEGWRFAFLSLAAVSGAAGVANLLLTEDPLYERRRRRQRQQAPAAAADALAAVVVDGEAAAAGGEAGPDAIAAGRAAAEEAELEAVERRSPSSDRSGQRGGWLRTPLRSAQGLLAAARPVAREVASVLRIPTFRIIVLQGIMGSIPWSALVFLTLYFQLLGMSDAQASALVALFLAGTAFGGLIGGCVGDAAAKAYPQHGRIAVTQFSVGIGVPFAFLIFKGLPRSGGSGNVALYAAVLLVFALLKAWPAPACNNPMFAGESMAEPPPSLAPGPCHAEIVPPHQRNLVYAFDRCFEGAIAACAAPLVGVLAERIFGFSGTGTVSQDRQQDLVNAAALGNALLAFLVVPWTLTLLLYTGLHWTYPADKAAALRQQSHALRECSHPLEEEGGSRTERSHPLEGEGGSRRERSHPLEEEGMLTDRLGTGSSSSPLSSGSAASIELPHHCQRQQLQRLGALQPAAEEAGGGGEEGERVPGRGASAGGGG
ncbi:hypothetical protein CHLNCDRAFT_141677 [Chlorella variabilis]|uniref:Major facilitator superfamily (MFS) profile domain-containing protein n=1 Tax=Chlorella variabilis TaxID=554065 RepID=E1ZTC8_CHLVA|nr:hypothetical protein CHLNCDRAFT_141677 [Chlorella variabilis]EFN50878.1 hypothetical protein CHLNCDRAFT_141677 [Chlorella variabilis]|eukprot:XP_005842980.1 hypothetical protein CHLNCDRAFT_141677 [Chlorella variabilis]